MRIQKALEATSALRLMRRSDREADLPVLRDLEQQIDLGDGLLFPASCKGGDWTHEFETATGSLWLIWAEE